MDKMRAELVALILAILALIGLVVLVRCGNSRAEAVPDEPEAVEEPVQAVAVYEEPEEPVVLWIEPEAVEPVDEYARVWSLIIEAANENGVDPVLAVAIWRHETGNGTSKAFIDYNNFGGLTGKYGLIEYADEEVGLKAYMNTLKNYAGKSLEEMGKTYCPDGTDWAGAVRKLMEEEK